MEKIYILKFRLYPKDFKEKKKTIINIIFIFVAFNSNYYYKKKTRIKILFRLHNKNFELKIFQIIFF